MPVHEALKYAGEFCEKVSVSYTGRSGAPLLFGQMPEVLKPLTLFLTYQQHQLGLLRNSFVLGMENAKAGNVGSAVKAFGALAGIQALQTGLFGLGGVAFSSLYDDMLYLMEQAGMPLNLPTTKEIGRKVDRWLDPAFGQKNIATLGITSELLGYDVSSSGKGVSMQASTAVMQTAATMLEAAVLSGKWALGKTVNPEFYPTKKETYEFAKTLPGSLKGTAEYLIKEDSLSDIVKVALGEKQDKGVSGKDVNLPTYDRTPAEARMRMAFGLVSNHEAQANITENIFNQKQAIIAQKIQHVDQLIKEGGLNDKQLQAAILDLAIDTNQMPATVVQQIINYKLSQQKTPEQRRFQPGSVKGLMDFQQYREIRGQEPKQ